MCPEDGRGACVIDMWGNVGRRSDRILKDQDAGASDTPINAQRTPRAIIISCLSV